ncbi:hypothetical protein CYY_007427 [Polysphondylium violaceum]|uniref:EGF-like domain-containing protein n=1 Tax=Polysphondylium violaceum TaxID=133409 RepID=A0A8J4PNM6_9MYCE|nr:hypothetical protein CYY_007427 [Polysphondylium violaceum]
MMAMKKYTVIVFLILIGSLVSVSGGIAYPILPYGIEPYANSNDECSFEYLIQDTIVLLGGASIQSCKLQGLPTVPCDFTVLKSISNAFTIKINTLLTSNLLPYNKFDVDFVLSNSTIKSIATFNSDGMPLDYTCLKIPTTYPTVSILGAPRLLNTSYSISNYKFQTYLEMDDSFIRPLDDSFFILSNMTGFGMTSKYIDNKLYLLTFIFNSGVSSFPETFSFQVSLTVVPVFSPVALGDYSKVKMGSSMKTTFPCVPNTGNVITYRSLDPTATSVIPVFEQDYIPMFGDSFGFMSLFTLNSKAMTPNYIHQNQWKQMADFSFPDPSSSQIDVSTVNYSPGISLSFRIVTRSDQGNYRFSFYMDELKIPQYYYYPFGLISVSDNEKIFILPTLVRLYQNQVVFNFGVTSYSHLSLSIINSTDSIAPKIESYFLEIINETISVLNLEFSDDISGFYYAAIQTDAHTYFVKGNNLVFGNSLLGHYEIYVPFKKSTSFNISIVDNTGNNQAYSNEYLFHNIGVPNLVSQPLLSSLLSVFYFNVNTVSVSNNPVNVILYLSLKNNNIELNSLLLRVFISQLANPLDIVGSFNVGNDLYQFQFTIPQKVMSSYLNYSLFINEQEIGSDILMGKFGNSAEVYIDNSGDFDMMPPIVLSASVSPNSTDDSPLLVFSLSFNEPKKKVIAQIAGDYDVLGRNFTFTDHQSVIINFKIEANRCRPQTYFINYLYTEDMYGNKGEYIRDSTTIVNGFYSFIDSLQYPYVSCPNNAIDSEYPSITSLSIQQLDSDPFKQLVLVNFTVFDEVPGVSTDNVPLCVFSASDNEFLSIYGQNISINSNGSINYQCLFNIPIGYGTNMFLSIYGISDLHFNYIGYNSDTLGLFNLPYSFNLAPISHPIITSTSSLEQSSEKLIIYGRNFVSSGGSILIDIVYYFNNGLESSETLPLSIITGTTLVLNNLPTANQYKLSVRETTYNLSSNVVILKGPLSSSSSSDNNYSSSSIELCNSDCGAPLGYGQCLNGICHCTPPYIGLDCKSPPAPTPTTTISNCKSDCGSALGYGSCINGACLCESNHSGLDCKSLIDTDTQIIPDPKKPFVNVTKNESSQLQYTSFISVLSLRELDNNNNLVSNYEFNEDKWILIHNNQNQHQYKYIINNLFNTTIVSTIEIFNQTTTVTFANQKLIMNPSTIKFTFNITSYPFSKSTNSLQLVMNVGLESNEKIACSYKEFVDDNQSEYIKIQIQDRSLFGRFIKFGFIDGRQRQITNQQIDIGSKQFSKQSTSDQSFIALNIPFYTNYSLLDPDFSVLLESINAGDLENSICTIDNSKKKLTNAQIAGVVIGGIVFLIVLILFIIFALSKKGNSNIAIKLRKIVGN